MVFEGIGGLVGPLGVPQPGAVCGIGESGHAVMTRGGSEKRGERSGGIGGYSDGGYSLCL